MNECVCCFQKIKHVCVGGLTLGMKCELVRVLLMCGLRDSLSHLNHVSLFVLIVPAASCGTREKKRIYSSQEFPNHFQVTNTVFKNYLEFIVL